MLDLGSTRLVPGDDGIPEQSVLKQGEALESSDHKLVSRFLFHRLQGGDPQISPAPVKIQGFVRVSGSKSTVIDATGA